MSEKVSSIDLGVGVVRLCDGQIVSITRYFGTPEEAPDDNAPVDGFGWVRSVVAGPDADGNWYSVQVESEDRDAA